jgi:hypothetical protein
MRIVRRLTPDGDRGIPPYRKERDRMGHPSVGVMRRKCIGPSSGTFALRRFRFLRMTRVGVSGLTLVAVRTLADKSVRSSRFVMKQEKQIPYPLKRVRNDKWVRVSRRNFALSGDGGTDAGGTGFAIGSQGDSRSAVAVALAGHQAPGFAITLEAGFASLVGIEPEAGASVDGGDGENVPGVLRHDVSYEKVDVVSGVRDFVSAGLDGIAAVALLISRLHLHPPAFRAAVHDEVKGGAVSPGLGDLKAKADGFAEECGFGGFTAAFGSTTFGKTAR